MSNGPKHLKALAKRIDFLREERGLSYQEMALACDMDKAQIYILCTKGTNITFLTAVKLAEGLGISLSELFAFK